MLQLRCKQCNSKSVSSSYQSSCLFKPLKSKQSKILRFVNISKSISINSFSTYHSIKSPSKSISDYSSNLFRKINHFAKSSFFFTSTSSLTQFSSPNSISSLLQANNRNGGNNIKKILFHNEKNIVLSRTIEEYKKNLELKEQRDKDFKQKRDLDFKRQRDINFKHINAKEVNRRKKLNQIQYINSKERMTTDPNPQEANNQKLNTQIIKGQEKISDTSFERKAGKLKNTDYERKEEKKIDTNFERTEEKITDTNFEGDLPSYHKSIMCKEIFKIFNPTEELKPGAIFVDATFGEGGHSRYLLENHPTCKVIGIDKDPYVAPYGLKLKEEFLDRFDFISGSFTDLSKLSSRSLFFQDFKLPSLKSEINTNKNYIHETKLREYYNSLRNFPKVDGILFDLGFSTLQVKDPSRGFSMKFDGPLDMRFNPDEDSQTAEEFINRASKQDLNYVFQTFGEEKFSLQITQKIIEERRKKRITRTLELANIIRQIYPPRPIWKKKRDPATLIFQGLRIFINKEFETIKKGIVEAESILAPGGYLAMLTFHSREDQLVKRILYFLSQHGVRSSFTPDIIPSFNLSNKDRRGKKAEKEECEENPRSRSALLRWCQRNENESIGYKYLVDENLISIDKVEDNQDIETF